MSINCPACGEQIDVVAEALLPPETDLTLVVQVAEGEMIQAKTLAGVVSAFDDMQKAIGEEMGATTTTLIRRLETDANELRVTFRICNAAQGIEAATAAETGETPAPSEGCQSGGVAASPSTPHRSTGE